MGGGEKVRGLAYGRLPVATVFALTTDNHLVSFKPLTPGTFDTDVAVTGLQGTEAIVGFDFRPSNGALYAVTDAGRLYTIDTATGAAAGAVTLSANTLDTTAPFTALSGTRFGVDFNPLDGQLRIQSDTGQNVRVDVDAGTVVTEANLNPGTPQVVGTAFTNSYAGATSTTQYELDVAAGALVRQTSQRRAGHGRVVQRRHHVRARRRVRHRRRRKRSAHCGTAADRRDAVDAVPGEPGQWRADLARIVRVERHDGRQGARDPAAVSDGLTGAAAARLPPHEMGSHPSDRGGRRRRRRVLVRGLRAESALLDQPVYRVLKKHEPVVYEKLVAEYKAYQREETSRENFINFANSEINLAATQSLAHASQGSVLALMKDMLSTARQLQKAPGDTCFRYWFPLVSGPPDIARYIEPAAQAHTLELMGEVIRSAAEEPVAAARARRGEGQPREGHQRDLRAVRRRRADDRARRRPAASTAPRYAPSRCRCTTAS